MAGADGLRLGGVGVGVGVWDGDPEEAFQAFGLFLSPLLNCCRGVVPAAEEALAVHLLELIGVVEVDGLKVALGCERWRGSGHFAVQAGIVDNTENTPNEQLKQN